MKYEINSVQTTALADTIVDLTYIGAPNETITLAINALMSAEDKIALKNIINEIIDQNRTPGHEILNDGSIKIIDKYKFDNINNSLISITDNKITLLNRNYPGYDNVIELSDKWVSCALNNEYHKWNNNDVIVISAPTGTGKNTFIEDCIVKKILIDNNNTYNYYERKNILLLSNRVALNLQNKKRLAQKVDMEWLTENYTDTGLRNLVKKLGPVYVMSYHQFNEYNKLSLIDKQKLAELGKHSLYYGIVETLENVKFDYVIADEAHFFLCDSMFNPYTQSIFKAITKYFGKSKVIFLSATCKEIAPVISHAVDRFEPSCSDTLLSNIKNRPLPHLRSTYYNFSRNTESNKQKHNYNVSVIDFADELADKIHDYYYDMFKLNTVNKNNKWLIFISSKEAGKKLLTNILELCPDISVGFITADNKNKIINNQPDSASKEKSPGEVFVSLTNDCKFECNVLISTTVLDNGINVKDPLIKNVAIDIFDETTTIQCAGRLRYSDGESKINLYLQSYNRSIANKKISTCRKVFNFFKSTTKYNYDANKLLQNEIPGLFYYKSNIDLELNKFAKEKANNDFNFFTTCNEKMYDDPMYFFKLQCEWLELDDVDVLTKQISDDNQQQIINLFKTYQCNYNNYLSEANLLNLGEDFQKLRIKLYGKRKSDRKDRPIDGITVMNNFLNSKHINVSIYRDPKSKPKEPYYIIDIN